MGLLENIATLISGVESSIYIGVRPSKAPDNVCGIYRITGRPPERDLDGIITYRNPSIRIVVRDTDYIKAEARMEAILTTLNSVDGTYGIMQIINESDIVSLGLDETKRCVEMYVNFSIKQQ